MTTEQTELTGAALAAEVAAKVMGWKLNKGGRSWMASRKGFQCCVAGFRPYEKIGQAWMVLERLDEHEGFFYELTDDCEGGHKCRLWRCRMHCEGNFDEVEMIAETAPLAICRAALKAIEANA